ncbi:MAG: DJ-1/PfpI family protein [Psychroserpens sp.]|uniref:DJ-1/PfpI family protein n=1 Tax=Psychroserpens sp. TaxID=2020870 RepID=UPI0030012C92
MLKEVIVFVAFLITLTSHAQHATSTYVCPPCDNTCDTKTFKKGGLCDVCHMKLITKEQLQMDMENKKNTEIKTIAFYLQDGVEVLDFAGPMEVFAYAGYKVFTVSKTKEYIISQGILKIKPDYSIKDAPEADVLAFFGGNAHNAYEDKEVMKWVQDRTNVDLYFSVCTGALVLAKAGVLDGNTATTFHSALEGLEKNYPKVKVRRDVRFVDNGKVITTAGVSAGIDGALHLVARFQGLEKAKEVAFYMEYDKWKPGEGLILTKENPYK